MKDFWIAKDGTKKISSMVVSQREKEELINGILITLILDYILPFEAT